MISRSQIVCVGMSLLSFAAALNAEPVGTAFTYQGQLKSDGVPVNDTCDFQFRLWDAAAGGKQLGAHGVPPPQVTNGLFTAKLDFGNAFDGNARWLEIEARCPAGVGSFTRLTPRQELTPGPYAIFALEGGGVGGNTLDQAYDQGGPGAGRTITADGGPVNIAGQDGLTVTGNVGIGTNSPDAKLHLSDPGDAPEVRLSGDSVMVDNEVWGAISVYKGASAFLGRTYWNGDSLGRPDWTLDTRDVPSAFVVDGATGKIGIGTSSPEARLHVAGDAKFESAVEVLGPIFLKDSLGQTTLGLHASAAGGGAAATLRNSAGNVTVLLDSDESDDGASLQMFDDTQVTIDMDAKSGAGGGASVSLYNSEGNRTVWIDADISDTSGIVLYRTDGSAAITLSTEFGGVGGAGRITTDVLVINGGSDLSEQFDVTSNDAAPEPGMVVCIDPENQGVLTVCRNVYDRTVAGVISGAGGVKPGMLMGQNGSVADGEHPVALAGRVYVLADASNGPIEPGDLLTTSSTPGHATKATDYIKAQGAILGKAMTSLESGTGLVLVLVSLQ